MPQREGSPQAVPPEVLAATREMRESALEARLKEIEMTAQDAAIYQEFVASVQKEIREIRVLLESMEAKHNERTWLKNQGSGDLDDAKLIEGALPPVRGGRAVDCSAPPPNASFEATAGSAAGITGERSIYKRRGEQPPELGAFQELPKRLHFVFDLSASMTRFNGHDGRLDRSMEAATMIMESFKNFDHKFKYRISGHSGRWRWPNQVRHTPSDANVAGTP